MKEFDDLTAEVARQTSVEKSALALIQGFGAQLAAAGTDPAKLGALAATLKANDDELAAAVAANTSAAPAAPAVPEVPAAPVPVVPVAPEVPEAPLA